MGFRNITEISLVEEKYVRYVINKKIKINVQSKSSITNFSNNNQTN